MCDAMRCVSVRDVVVVDDADARVGIDWMTMMRGASSSSTVGNFETRDGVCGAMRASMRIARDAD